MKWFDEAKRIVKEIIDGKHELIGKDVIITSTGEIIPLNKKLRS
jgi:hypothetical protein